MCHFTWRKSIEMALPLAGASEALGSRRPRRARGFAGWGRTAVGQEGQQQQR